jgi:uncharacterized membrane protein HdeD (DUF308 family)
MDAVIDQVEKIAGTELRKLRWALGLNGILSIAAGIIILIWPSISLYALAVIFGAYVLATGLVGVFHSFTAQAGGERGWLLFSSLLGIAVGVMVLAWPGISAVALLYVIGAYAIALGVLAIAGAFWLPIDGGDTALMVLSGAISILFGIVMFARPGAGALVTLALIAAFALVTGVTELIVAIGGRALLNGRRMSALGSSRPQPTH